MPGCLPAWPWGPSTGGPSNCAARFACPEIVPSTIGRSVGGRLWWPGLPFLLFLFSDSFPIFTDSIHAYQYRRLCNIRCIPYVSRGRHGLRQRPGWEEPSPPACWKDWKGKKGEHFVLLHTRTPVLILLVLQVPPRSRTIDRQVRVLPPPSTVRTHED